MNFEMCNQNAVDNEGSIAEIAFEETLKQMRTRRYSTLKRQSFRKNDDNEPLPMPSLHESTSGYSQASSVETEELQSAYWRRISEERRNPSFGLKPISPKSTSAVKEIFDWEALSKVPESFFADRAADTNKPAVDFGDFEEEARKLEYTNETLHELMDRKEFRRLQRSLRHKGAVTNEMLKQVLPLVVKQAKARKQRDSQTSQFIA